MPSTSCASSRAVEPRFPTEHHQLPRPLDDALIVAIGERWLVLLPRRDRGAQAALQAEQPFLLYDRDRRASPCSR